MPMIVRSQARVLLDRLGEARRFVHVVAGPRQVGKTTLVRWALGRCKRPTRFAGADDAGATGSGWLVQQWELARVAAREAGRGGAVLAIDEVQKIPQWTETVKRLWDEDTAARLPLRVVILGSAPLLIEHGITESLAGRFEVIRVPHWSLGEMHEAFGFGLDRYLAFGGYPGAAPLVRDPARWSAYVRDSLVETTLARDVLQLTRVEKPMLLRRLFEFACTHSAQQLSYQKMLGQLQDAGNTVTLAHYLRLLAAAGMVMGIEKYSGSTVRQRASSPKLQVLNNALATAMLGDDPRALLADPETRGRLTESAVGAHLANAAAVGECTLHYWRERDLEVDFVVAKGRKLLAIEVKSGRKREGVPGVGAFCKAYPEAKPLLVGTGGIAVEEFLRSPVGRWLK